MTTLLTLAEAAAYLRVSPKTLRRWIKAGKVPASQPGKEYRLRQEDLDALLTD